MVDFTITHLETTIAEPYEGDIEIECTREQAPHGETGWNVHSIRYQNGIPIEIPNKSQFFSDTEIDLQSPIHPNPLLQILGQARQFMPSADRFVFDNNDSEWRLEVSSISETNEQFETFKNSIEGDLEALWQPVVQTNVQRTIPVPLPVAANALKPKDVEAAVEQLIGQIDASKTDVSFLEKTYALNVDNLNLIVNQALADSGSQKRFFAASDGMGHTSYVYGTMKSEELQDIKGQKVRLVSLEKIEKKSGIDIGHLAINDGFGTIILFKPHISLNLNADLTHISYYSYQNPVHQAVVREVTKFRKPEDEKLLVGDIVLGHEGGHYELTGTHGAEQKVLETTLEEQNFPALHALSELYCDLVSLGQVVEKAKQDPDAARRAALYWTVVRTSGDNGNPMNQSEMATSLLLLSTMQTSPTGVVVDWSLLQTRIDSLKRELDSIYKTIAVNLKKDIFGLFQINATQSTDSQINTAYETILTTQVIPEFKRQNPSIIDNFSARKGASMGLAKQALQNATAVQSYIADVMSYQRRVDDWYRTNLGLSDQQVPFKAEFVLTLDPNKPVVPQLQELVKQGKITQAHMDELLKQLGK